MNAYGLPDGYVSREQPTYFVDNRSDGKLWQPDVLGISAHLARVIGAKNLIDIGCGRGEKLTPYAGEFGIVGVDFGDNLAVARRHPFGHWIECDLNVDSPEIDKDIVRNAVLICSDTIEHLTRPDNLVLTLKMMLVCAPLLILTTPDRERVYGYNQLGPPGNPFHISEWTLSELTTWLATYGLYSVWSGWTVSNNVDRQRNTSLVVLAKAKMLYNSVAIETLFEVEKADATNLSGV